MTRQRMKTLSSQFSESICLRAFDEKRLRKLLRILDTRLFRLYQKFIMGGIKCNEKAEIPTTLKFISRQSKNSDCRAPLSQSESRTIGLESILTEC